MRFLTQPVLSAATIFVVSAFALKAGASISNSKSSLTLVFQNNLNASDDCNHVGAIVLDPAPAAYAAASCASLGESLLTQATVLNYSADFSEALAYLSFAYAMGKTYQIANGSALTLDGNQIKVISSASTDKHLSILCTQTSTTSQAPNSTASPMNEIRVPAAGNIYTGFRNKKSFRFLGIRYADEPERFKYSSLYSGRDENINATVYGSQCVQVGGGSEDCLFLNILTPYIPKVGSKQNLRPVLFWIHGGGFTGGTGADPLTDGGNLASREDIVVVTVNYRLSTLGFLSIPGTDIRGNFGIGDQITALSWIRSNIASFGGDPDRVTIMGESAGAGSVRTLLGSPPAMDLFQGAVAMSNLGGGRDLGLGGNYGTTYSNYYTINDSFTVAGPQIFNASNCTRTDVMAQIACLKQINATQLVSQEIVARYVVQDGIIVTTPQLDVTTRNESSAYVPIMFGITANDGASFSTLSSSPVTNLTAGIQIGLSINESYARAIIDSGLFPLYDTGNLTLDAFNVSQRVAQDNTFRCIDQATVYAGAVTETFPATYYYQIERTIDGYNPNNLPGAPITPGYPNGNPNLPYFKLHGSDLPWPFGNLYDPLRDANDLYSIQLVSSYFATFVKTGQPNPSEEYLTVRGRSYENTLRAIQATGPWQKVHNETGPIMFLDYPATIGNFVDKPQCAWLNYSLDYYLN